MASREEEILDADENKHGVLRNKIPEMVLVMHRWMEEEMETEIFTMTMRAELSAAGRVSSSIGGSVSQNYDIFADEIKIFMTSSRDKKQFDRVLNAAQCLSNSLEQL